MYIPSNTLIPLIELNAEKMRGRPTIITPHDGTTTRISRCGGDACIVLRRVYDTGTNDITHKRYIYEVQHTLPRRIYDANVRAVSPGRGDCPAPPRAGASPAFRGRFLLRPLEEPLRTGHARRGGGGVDEEGGRLRRPGPTPARSCAAPSIVLIMPVQCAPPGRGDASVPPPHRSTPAPTRLMGTLQKNLPLRAPLPPLRDATGVHLSISGHLTDPHRSAPTRMMRSVCRDQQRKKLVICPGFH